MSIDEERGKERSPLSFSDRILNRIRSLILPVMSLIGPAACVERTITQIEHPPMPQRVELSPIPILSVNCYPGIADRCFFGVPENNNTAVVSGKISNFDWIQNPDHQSYVLDWTVIKIFQNGQKVKEIQVGHDGSFRGDLTLGNYEMFAQVEPEEGVQIIQTDPIDEGILSPVYPFQVIHSSELPRR